MEFFKQVYWNLTVLQWLIFIFGSILLLFGLRIFLTILYNRTKKHIEHTKIELDDLILSLINKINTLTLFAIAVWFVHIFLPFSEEFTVWMRVFFLSCLYLQIGVWAVPIYSYLLHKVINGSEEESRQASITMVVKILSWITYIILGIMAVDTLPSVDVTTLIATMGIGGIAIAFALQNVLSDFTSALTIAFDQPFEQGDAILVDGIGGTVEKIGLKSTRLRSWDGQEIVISNSDLLGSRINNFKTMERRRVVLNFGVIYKTKAADLERIPDLVKEIITAEEQATYARTHSTKINNSAVDFECVYYVESADFNLFMDIRHRVNVALIRRFEKEKIEFAYPTQTIYVEQ
jgi:small-conductance mechanosensitive channel